MERTCNNVQVGLGYVCSTARTQIMRPNVAYLTYLSHLPASLTRLRKVWISVAALLIVIFLYTTSMLFGGFQIAIGTTWSNEAIFTFNDRLTLQYFHAGAPPV